MWILPIDELEGISLYTSLSLDDLVPTVDRSHTVIEFTVSKNERASYYSLKVATTPSLAKELERWCNKVDEIPQDSALNLNASSSDLEDLLLQLTEYAPLDRIFTPPFTPPNSPNPRSAGFQGEQEEASSSPPPRLRENKRSRLEDEID